MKSLFIILTVISTTFLVGVIYASFNASKAVVPIAQTGEIFRVAATINNSEYVPAQIDIPLGAKVKLTVQNNDQEQHGLFIDSFGIREVIPAGKSQTVSFTASPAGESTTFCSANHPEKLIINVL